MDAQSRPDALVTTEGFQVSKSPWGPDDEIGRLNWITAESRAEILARVDGTRMVDLSVEYFIGMPSFTATGWPAYEIQMTSAPRGSIVDNATTFGDEINERTTQTADSICLNTHTGTHIDALNHFGYHGLFWNGVRADRDLGSRHWLKGGVDHYPPIIARGVLLDIAGLHGVDELPGAYEITPDDLQAATREHGVELRRGDVVLIRTGRMRQWPDKNAYILDSPGLGLAAARWLCEENDAMCIGGDTIALEVLPPREPGQLLPVHSYMFATCGAQIIEMAELENLAAERIHEFALMGFPLRLRGATASPLRLAAIALRD